MIDSKVFKIAQLHADAFQDASGKAIFAAGRSELAALVGLSAVSPVDNANGNLEYADMLEATTRDDAEAPSFHSNAIGGMIDRLVPAVSRHIEFIQTQVRPKVSQLETAMSDIFAKLDRENPAGLFDVVQVSTPAPLADESLVEFVTRFADSAVTQPGNLGNLPAISLEEVLKVVSVSSTEVDATVKRWLAERGDAWVMGIWRTYFAYANMAPVEGAPDLIPNISAISSLPIFQRMEVALAVFLLSRGLLDEPLENAGMSLAEWRASMDRISRFTANEVNSTLKLFEMIKSSQTLILSFNEREKRIFVHAPVYMQYLQEGGSLEDVLGAALSGNMPTYSLGSMREKGEEYRSIWNNYEAVGRASLNIRAARILANECKSQFLTVAMACNDDEKALFEERGITFEKMQAQVDEYVDSLSLAQLKDSRELALKIIAGIRFKHTPAESFLRDMYEAESAGCKDAREAAFIASMNYVCDYLSTMLAIGTPE